ncbi:hypothetical protein [Streptomyces sp. MUM 2J]|uniref:hypothetical protein n=1 Tax=Streptomyces sp. MUM 2J TaxID=2791987 RepID=UPI001F04129C|nr:hypothetical protein [Streptomyces sp. MUM 2J]
MNRSTQPADKEVSSFLDRRAYVAVIAAGLLATGCSTALTGSAAGVAPPTVGATPTAPASGYDGLMRLPLSAYGTSEQDDAVLYRTNEALITRCMRSRGHAAYASQNTPSTAPRTRQEKEAIHPAGAWGYIGRTTAKRIGFHVAVPLPAARVLTGRALKDYNTCYGEAEKQLPSLSGTQGWKLAQDLFGESFRQAAVDSRVGAARERWSACMSAVGHPADAPEELAAGPWHTGKPTAQEIAAATADTSCTRSSGLAAVYFAVLAGYQQQLISANARVLTGYQKQVQEQMDQAAHILTASPTA